MFKSLKARLTASYLVIMMLTIGFLGLAFYQIMSVNLGKSVEQEMLVQANTMAKAVGPVMAREGVLPLEHLITSKGRWYPTDILVTDEHGAVLFSTKKIDTELSDNIMSSIISPTISGGKPTKATIEEFSEPSVAIGVPIVAKGERQGALVLFKSVEDIRQTGMQTLLLVVRAALISGALILILSIMLAQRMTKTAEEIGRVLAQIADGDLTARVGHRGQDEISELAGNVNLMAERLQKSVDRIKSQEMNRRDLMANISHELRTPITTIRGFSEALSDGLVQEDAEKDKYYRIINRQANYIERLTKDMFEVSRLENNMVEMHFEKFDLAELVQSLTESLDELVSQQNLSFALSKASPKLFVIGDSGRIRQVIDILVDNAVSFTNPGGEITLSIEKMEREAWVHVTDNGVGISTENLPQVWDRFFRKDRPRSGAYQGTGLGLAIGKQIIEAHGGRVWAESTLGAGSCFSFSLLLT